MRFGSGSRPEDARLETGSNQRRSHPSSITRECDLEPPTGDNPSPSPLVSNPSLHTTVSWMAYRLCNFSGAGYRPHLGDITSYIGALHSYRSNRAFTVPLYQSGPMAASAATGPAGIPFKRCTLHVKLRTTRVSLTVVPLAAQRPTWR